MIIKGISVRLKQMLTTLVTLVFLVVLSLVILNAVQQLTREKELLDARSGLSGAMRSLEHSYLRLATEGQGDALAACISQTRELESRIRGVLDRGNLAGDEQLVLKASQLQSSLDQLQKDVRLPGDADSLRREQAGTDLVVLGRLMEEFNQGISSQQEGSLKTLRIRLAASLVLWIVLIALFMSLFSFSLSRAFGKIISYTGRLREGQLPPPLDFPPGDEFGQMAGDLNSHVGEIGKKISYISSLAAEGATLQYTPEELDELGQALRTLSETISRKDLEEVSRNREDKKQNWISEGMAQLGEVLRSQRENVGELSYAVIQKLVTYMKVEMGSLYMAGDGDEGRQVLELAASYAYDRRKYRSATLEWGEGLPGTCAQEKKRIFLTDVPEDYFEVSSGTGSSRPNCILLVPMILEGEVSGVVELATVRLLKPYEIEFVESQAESIASSLTAVRINERTSELLRQSQAQAEALKSQDAAMRENMKQLEEAQAESSRKEAEIAGILGAMDQSALVAELGLNGRFTSINDRFLLLLESPRDQVLGKRYSEFAAVDPYSEEYKAFWESLKKGESISNTEKYRLFSGREIWLQQTFTPISNTEGKVHRILNIAVDITETRSLQEQLESQGLEITRRSLDMQTLNQAVNTALIKCELDPEGIIMEVNEKYTEVTGYSRKELLGRNYRLFLKDTEKEQFEKIWEEVKKEKVYEGVIRRSKPTGEEAWLVSTFSPVIDEAGTIYKIYFMGFDITEKKLKYQLLEDANQEIERLRARLKDYEA